LSCPATACPQTSQVSFTDQSTLDADTVGFTCEIPMGFVGWGHERWPAATHTYVTAQSLTVTSPLLYQSKLPAIQDKSLPAIASVNRCSRSSAPRRILLFVFLTVCFARHRELTILTPGARATRPPLPTEIGRNCSLDVTLGAWQCVGHAPVSIFPDPLESPRALLHSKGGSSNVGDG